MRPPRTSPSSFLPICRRRVLGALLLALPACTATYTRARVGHNPLPRLAKELEKDYATRLVGTDHLEVRDTWIWHSILALGWSSCHTNLDYRDGTLYAETYLRSVGPGSLFIPMTIDAGPGFLGWLIRPAIKAQDDEVLGASAASVVEVEHTGWQTLEERSQGGRSVAGARR